jgi:hypothetical protein
MHVTIYTDGERPQIHRAGCADLAKIHETMMMIQTEVDSKADAAMVVWSDLIDEGSMSVDEAVSYCTFKPCTAGLKRA